MTRFWLKVLVEGLAVLLRCCLGESVGLWVIGYWVEFVDKVMGYGR